jgi:hypothetical protein
VDDGTVVDPKIEKPPAKKAEPAQATATKKTTSLKKRKSE